MPEQDLVPTPGQTVGPFFHFALSVDKAHELVPLGSAGAVRLHGWIFDGAGDPLPDALVEIRQADATGRISTAEGSLRRDGVFTGWGRAATDPGGHFSFTTVEPAPYGDGAAFFAVTVFARGLLDRLFTRAYLPGQTDAFLEGLDEADRSTLLVVREADGGLRFDIHLQGADETVFVDFPGHRR
jgi:protocatechuate 3,4-dioxygenase, alpha subunit